mgnify:CR=1 FL=1
MIKRFSKIYFDPYLFFSIFLISILGLFFLFSASNGDISIVFKQSIYVIFGFFLMILVSQPDPDLFRRTSFLFLIFWFIFFFSNIKTKGATAKKPTKNRIQLKVKGPILSMPASWAINVVPQIKLQLIKQTSDIVFFINLNLYS